MSRMGFLTATGILMIAFSIWGLLWTVTAQLYVGNDAKTWSIGYGLVWVYVGVLICLVALVWTLFVGAITRGAIILFGTAATLAILQLLASLFSVLWKVAFTGMLWKPMFTEPMGFPSGFLMLGLIVLLPIIAAAVWSACVFWIEYTARFFDNLIGNQD